MKSIPVALLLLLCLTLPVTSAQQKKEKSTKGNSQQRLAGTYKNYQGRTFSLKSDGTFEADHWGCGPHTGRWKIEGNKLVLTPYFSVFTIKGGDFEDEYEDKWSTLSDQGALLQGFNDIAASAYQYRVRPKSMGGGQGSYEGFTLSGKFEGIKIVKVSPNEIVVEKGGVVAIIDRNGSVTLK